MATSTHKQRAAYNKRHGAGAWAAKQGKTPSSSGSTAAQTSALEQLYGKTGIQAGEELVNKYLQPGSLGRMSTPGALSRMSMPGALGRVSTEASPEQKAAMERMKAGLGGYTSQEYQASREQMQRGLNSNLATSLAQLAKGQARGKVYGAAATAQQGNQLRSAQNTKDNLEQDLMVKNIDEMRSRLGEYTGQANTLYGQNMAAQQTNLSQEQAERAAQTDAQKTNLSQEEKERAAQTDAEKTNLGQVAAETSGAINAITGMGGQQLLKDQLEEMRKIQLAGIRNISR